MGDPVVTRLALRCQVHYDLAGIKPWEVVEWECQSAAYISPEEWVRNPTDGSAGILLSLQISDSCEQSMAIKATSSLRSNKVRKAEQNTEIQTDRQTGRQSVCGQWNCVGDAHQRNNPNCELVTTNYNQSHALDDAWVIWSDGTQRLLKVCYRHMHGKGSAWCV